MLIDTFINAIFLYDDKMVITFNYKEGTKTITLAELPEAISNKNGSDLNCLVAPKNRTPLRGRPVFWYLRRTRKGGDSAAAAKMRPVDAFLARGRVPFFSGAPRVFYLCSTPRAVSRRAQSLSAVHSSTLSRYLGRVRFSGNICANIIFRSILFRPKSRSAFFMARRAW